MEEYHKIQTIYLRDPENNYKTLLDGQFAMEEFEYLANNEWIFTEKVDGTNIRVMFDGVKITFGGKTERAQIPPFLLDYLNKAFLPQLEIFKESYPDGVCLYGEGYGARIQKGGGNYRQDQSFVLFDVKIGDWWLKREDVLDIGVGQLGIQVVPEIGRGTLYDMVELCWQGFPSRWGDFTAEGIVARPKVELVARNGKRIITKIKHKDFA